MPVPFLQCWVEVSVKHPGFRLAPCVHLQAVVVAPCELSIEVNGFKVSHCGPTTGRTTSSKRPADCCQRRVAVGQNQPGSHGDATQIHVDRRQQTWDDPAHRGQTSGQKERGKEQSERQNALWVRLMCVCYFCWCHLFQFRREKIQLGPLSWQYLNEFHQH